MLRFWGKQVFLWKKESGTNQSSGFQWAQTVHTAECGQWSACTPFNGCKCENDRSGEIMTADTIWTGCHVIRLVREMETCCFCFIFCSRIEEMWLGAWLAPPWDPFLTLKACFQLLLGRGGGGGAHNPTCSVCVCVFFTCYILCTKTLILLANSSHL